MCISSEGIVFYTVKKGSFKASSFVAFLQALIDNSPALKNGEVCLVMDNARIHHSRDATVFLRDNNINRVFLPPYSSELNPIENVFGVLKARDRRRGVVHSRGRMKRRIKIVIDEMKDELDDQTFYDHMGHFVEMAMNRQPFN